MTTPTQAAIEAARERLAKVNKHPDAAQSYGSGHYDGHPTVQALAIALQEMSDAMLVLQEYLGGEGWALGRTSNVTLADGRSVAFNNFILPDPPCPIKAAADAIVAERFPVANPQNEWALKQVAYYAVKRGMELAKGGDA